MLTVFLAITPSREGQRPADRVASLLGPVLCRSSEDQAVFRRVAASWFSPHPGARRRLVAAEDADEDARRKTAERAARIRALLALSAGLLLVITVSALALDSLFFHAADGVLRRNASVSPGTLLLASGPALSAVAASSPWLAIVLVMGVVFAGILAVAVGGRHAYARQLRVTPGAPLRQLLLSGPAVIEPRTDFFRAVQPFRRQVTSGSDELDVDASIERTIAAGGYPVPVLSTRRLSPEYVILLDKRGRNDHAALHCESLIWALKQAGVAVQTYEFDQDPRRLIPARGGRALDLSDVTIGAETRRLIVFSDGAGLLDDRFGAPWPWTVEFAAWPNCLLLTWRNSIDWSQRERVIEEELGFVVLPASEDGVIAAAALFEPEPGVSYRGSSTHFGARVARNARRLDGLLAPAAWRGMDAVQPEPEELERLIAMLTEELTAPAFEWLSALAVYPALSWRLTLYLGRSVIVPRYGEESMKSALLEIARLPWLRYAHMPAWIRRELLAELPSGVLERVRDALDTMFHTTTAKMAKDISLDVVVGTSELEQLDRDDRQRDAVVIDVIARRAARPIDFPIPSVVASALGLRRSFALRRRSTRFGERDAAVVWRPVLCGAAVFAMFAVGLGFGSCATWGGDFGWTLKTGVSDSTVVSLVAGGPAVRAGIQVDDRILEVTSALGLRSFRGRPTTVSVIRNGRQTSREITPRAAGAQWDLWFDALALLTIAFIALLIAMSPEAVKARFSAAGFVSFAAAGGWGLVVVPWTPAELITPALATNGLFGAISFAAFAASAGVRRDAPFQRAVQGLAYLSAASAVTLAVGGSVFLARQGAAGSFTWWKDASSIALFAAAVTAFLANAFALTSARASDADRDAWERGAACAFTGSASAILLLSKVLAFGFAAELVVLSAVACASAVTMAYALFGRRLLNFDFALQQLLTLIVLAMIEIPLIGLLLISPRGAAAHAVGNTAAAIIVLLLVPAWRLIRSEISVVLFARRKRRLAALSRISHEARAFQDTRTLIERTVREVAAVCETDDVALLLEMRGTRLFQTAYGCGRRQPEITEQDLAIRTMYYSEQSVDLRDGISALQGEYAFPLSSWPWPDVFGVLVCGSKASGASYAPDERRALEEVARSVGSALSDIYGRPSKHVAGSAARA